MSSPFGRMLLVTAPEAGRGSVLPRLRSALAARDLAHDVVAVRAPGEATAEVVRAVGEGRRFVVAVGQDRTVHEVVNGLVDPGSGPRAEGLVLGVVPAGPGCDFARTFGLDRAPDRLAAHLDGETLYPLDVGRIRLRDLRGGERSVLFANVAQVGYGATVARRVARLPRFLGRLRDLVAVAASIRRSTMTEATVTVDHTDVTEPMTNVVVANGQFFGRGMKVAPRALPDDGLFNVQVWRGRPRDVFLMAPRLRVGEHLPDETIREWQSSTVTVKAHRPMPVEGDGEVLGTTPARFDLLGRILNLKI